MPKQTYFSAKVFKNHQVVSKRHTANSYRFSAFLKKADFLDSKISVYIKVAYGVFEDNFDKMTEFCNEGIYSNKKKMYEALEIFREEI